MAAAPCHSEDSASEIWAAFKTTDCENRSGIYLKVTDSVIRALEEYQKLDKVHHAASAAAARNPTLQVVDENQGVICIPSSSGEDHKYRFSVSKIHGDTLPFSQTDIAHNNCSSSRGVTDVGTFGKISLKATIQAKDDSYHATSQKIKQVDEEQKKACTKVLQESSGPHISTVRKKVYKPSKPSPLRQPPPAPSLSVARRPPTPSGLSTSISPSLLPSSTTSPPLSSSSQSSNNSSSSGVSSMTGAGASPPTSTSVTSSSNYTSISKQQPQVNGYSSKTVSKLPVTANSNIIKRTIRERIIHLLAVKPYKYPELYLRLMKDGLKESSDKEDIRRVLSDVASERNSTYTLKRHVFGEVDSEWPFYTTVDRELLKRNLPYMRSPAGLNSNGRSPGASSTTSSSHSPTSTTNPTAAATAATTAAGAATATGATAPPPSNLLQLHGHRQNHQKRQYSDVDNALVGRDDFKRSRISPGSKENVPDENNSELCDYSGGSGPGGNAGTANGWMSLTKSNNSSSVEHSPASQTSPASQYSHDSQQSLPMSWSSHYSTSPQKPNGKGDKEIRKNGRVNGHISPPPTATSTTVDTTPLADYEIKYTDIINDQQREMYKHDFEKEYAEYKMLHSHMDQVFQTFKKMQQELKLVKYGSEKYKQLKERIIDEYVSKKSDTEYQEEKCRFDYLCLKLNHIKYVVAKYDESEDSRGSRLGAGAGLGSDQRLMVKACDS